MKINTKSRVGGLLAALLLIGCGGTAATQPASTAVVGSAIAAPVVPVPDVDAALAYYCGALSFRCDPEARFAGVDPAEGSVYAVVERDGIQVHLQIRRSSPPPREAHEVDFIVSVEDVRPVFSEYQARSVTFIKPLATTPWGTHEFTIEDPWGNRATFSSRAQTEVQDG